MPPTENFIREQKFHERASCQLEMAGDWRPTARLIPCHKTAIVECSDCGLEVCKDHAIYCPTCDEWFCMVYNQCSCLDGHTCSAAVTEMVDALAAVIL